MNIIDIPYGAMQIDMRVLHEKYRASIAQRMNDKDDTVGYLTLCPVDTKHGDYTTYVFDDTGWRHTGCSVCDDHSEEYINDGRLAGTHPFGLRVSHFPDVRHDDNGHIFSGFVTAILF